VILYFPTCFFARTITDTSQFVNKARAAFDFCPDTWEVSVANATIQLRMDRNSTGVALSADLINFHAVVFPYYNSAWAGGAGSIYFETNSASNFGGSYGASVGSYFNLLGPKIQLVQTFNTTNGLVAVAMVLVGKSIVLPNWNWNDDSALYLPGYDVLAGDGVRQTLPMRSSGYRRRSVTFEYIQTFEYEYLREAYDRCLGGTIPFFVMEDDSGNPNTDADMYRFVRDGFSFTQPATGLYTVRTMLEEYPRIPVKSTGTVFRYPF
jgi:hypothetical protein